MKEPPSPANEIQRVGALRRLQILDTVDEQRFDRYTRLACRLFDMPISAISLVDSDRQWFKSSCGLSERETPRDISFCGHAIVSEDVFEVPDTLLDSRFVDNPLVSGQPNLRFYAAVPLKTKCDNIVGTLCIMDRKPRSLSKDDRKSLRELGSMVADELGTFMDELTGISNRRGFSLAIENVINKEHQIKKDVVFSIFDLDNFKKINDTFGHPAGDEALRAFAELLCEEFRKDDTVYRLGGDEFCVLLPETGYSAALQRVDILREHVANWNQHSELPFILEFSVGIHAAKVGDGRQSISSILAATDQLLYLDKARRKGAKGRSKFGADPTSNALQIM